MPKDWPSAIASAAAPSGGPLPTNWSPRGRARACAPRPEGISDQVAATLSIAGLTASAALQPVGLRDGDTILIGGAGGGVGVFVAQLAKLTGARVIGTGSD
jgi:NADPH:quinone reductase-like Zn-dependent oxidoreductase